MSITHQEDHISSQSWFALHIRPRGEKAAARLLKQKSYPVFLPTAVRSQWGQANRRSESPLFPGYLFCEFDVRQRLPVLSTPGVLGVVSRGKCPEPISEAELEGLRQAVLSGLPMDTGPLEPGQPITIQSGPLRGMSGVFKESTDGGFSLVVAVTILQRSVSVRLEREMIAPLLRGSAFRMEGGAYDCEAPKYRVAVGGLG